MLILSIDSAGSACSACLWKDSVVIAETREDMDRGQDQRILPMILALLEQTKTTFDDIDRIAVTRGPGSFTGLRIGLAAARGIGFASRKPVFGIDRFSIFREQISDNAKNLLVVLQSKRAELYCAYYPSDHTQAVTSMMTRDEVLSFLQNNPHTVVSGDCADLELPNYLKATEPEIVTSARLASRITGNDPMYEARPLYIRPPDVTIKAKPVEA